MTNEQKQKSLEEAIGENPKLFGSLFLVVLGLMIGYSLEANNMRGPLVIIPLVLVLPASFTIFKMLLSKKKK